VEVTVNYLLVEDGFIVLMVQGASAEIGDGHDGDLQRVPTCDVFPRSSSYPSLPSHHEQFSACEEQSEDSGLP
jgi:hypothetical protein